MDSNFENIIFDFYKKSKSKNIFTEILDFYKNSQSKIVQNIGLLHKFWLEFNIFRSILENIKVLSKLL